MLKISKWGVAVPGGHGKRGDALCGSAGAREQRQRNSNTGRTLCTSRFEVLIEAEHVRDECIAVTLMQVVYAQ